MTTSLKALASFLQQHSTQRVVVLTDTHVDALYSNYLDEALSSFDTHKIVVPAGEQHKNIEQATAIWQELLNRGYDKNTTIVNFGGGMISDLGGFVAATYKRGVRCVNYPTTLLAMIDAAIGGKTGVNLNHVKNCVGLIRQPDYVVPADVELLKTLPQQELISGFGELIKYAVIASRPLFDELSQLETLTAESIRTEWIDLCVQYKEKIVALDPEDRKERRILNFGHTYGHALESHFAAMGKPIPHGVAVAIGILFECQRIMQQGMFSKEDFTLVEKLVRRHFEVPVLDKDLELQLQSYLVQDKKNSNGQISFVQLLEIGKSL